MIQKYVEKNPDDGPPEEKSSKKKKVRISLPEENKTRTTLKRTAAERKANVSNDSDDGDKNDKDDDYDENKPLKKSTPKKKKKGEQSKEPVYEVSKIVDDKMKGKIKMYRIRWVGYGAKDDTWEPVASLSCPDKINDYEDNKNDESDAQYDVEKIMGEKIESGQRFFLVKWKGWGEKSNTWEPEESVECFELVEKFRDSCRSVKPKAVKQSPVKKAKAKYVKKGKKGVEKRGRPKKKARKQESDVEDGDDETGNDEEEQENTEEDNETGDEATDWVVEKIVKERDTDGKKEYLIRWKGYKAADDTWEPEESVDNCQDLLADFLKKKKK